MSKLTRREFTKKMGQSLVAVPAVMVAAQSPSHADDKPMIDPESAAAKPLQFKMVSEVEANCAGCLLYTASDDNKGACSIFPGNSVPAAGWCTAYNPRPA